MEKDGITAGNSRPSAHLRVASACLAALLLLSLTGCGAGFGSGPSGDTSGPSFERPSLALSPLDPDAAVESNGALVDATHLAEGYVAVSATSSARLKLQVTSSGMDYYYDLPNDGTPLSCPLNMGDGRYEITVWENTSGNRYAALSETFSYDVVLADEFQPFVRPNVFCQYDETSDCVKLANELTADAENEGDALRAVYEWIVENIDYDDAKAEQLADAPSYVPDPDSTLSSEKGICFDYASLAAAMLRSQGIPCKIITGNVSPDNIYHAWNMVYIDGTWVTAGFSVDQNTWTRIDLTFAAGSGSAFVGDGTSYTDRYTY